MKKIILIITSFIAISFLIILPQKSSNDIEEISVVLSSDKNYALGLTVTLASILKNANNKDKLTFYILKKNIPEFYKKKIASLQTIKPFKITYIDITKKTIIPSHLSKPTYYRYFPGDLFPHHEKIIYLDSDLYVFKSLSSLWKQNIKNKYIAAVEDMHSKRHTFKNQKTFNTGVMLFNLNLNRQKKISEKATQADLKLRIKEKHAQKDQATLNYLYKNKIKWLPVQYNFHHKCPKTSDVKCYPSANSFSS